MGILLPFCGASGLLLHVIFSRGLSGTTASSGLPKAQKKKFQDFLKLRPGHGTVPLLCIVFVKSHRPAQTSHGRGPQSGINTRGQGLLGVTFGACCPTEKKQSYDLTLVYRPWKEAGLADTQMWMPCHCTDLLYRDT